MSSGNRVLFGALSSVINQYWHCTVCGKPEVKPLYFLLPSIVLPLLVLLLCHLPPKEIIIIILPLKVLLLLSL